MLSMAIAVVLGAAIGITIGTLGAGGTILGVPVLVHLVGLPVETATATSLVAVGSASALAAGTANHRQCVRWDVAVWFVLVGIAGSFGGAELGRHLDSDALLLAFSVVIVLAGVRMFTSGAAQSRAAGLPPEEVEGTASTVRRVAIFAGVGVVVGFLTGLFGVGGGFVVVPALALLIGFSMQTAVATSLVIVAGNAAVSLVIRGFGAVDWPAAGAFTGPMLIGSLVGSAIASKLNSEKASRVFAVVLVLVAIGNALSVLL